MSVRLFAGYFLALAACAIVAFGSSEPDPTALPFGAEAGMMPMGFSAYRGGFPTYYAGYPASSFSLRPHKLVPKRIRREDAQ